MGNRISPGSGKKGRYYAFGFLGVSGNGKDGVCPRRVAGKESGV
jgi:hypothetical protein